jgi:NAD(P)-dependent dehydrogenase (short-subunit alcohol dehydrogenase family)
LICTIRFLFFFFSVFFYRVFLITASAAGLLSSIGDASYAVSKHAAVGLAETMAISHGDENIRVFCLCPQAVDTNMAKAAGGTDPKKNPAMLDGLLKVGQVADEVEKALETNTFLILPHESVAKYMVGRATNYQRWIKGMTKWRRSML